MEKLTMEILNAILLLVNNGAAWDVIRAAADSFNFQPTTIIPMTLIDGAMVIRNAMYNPADKGARGKMVEVENRIARKRQNGVKWVYWYDLSARRQGTWDMRTDGMIIECKSGAGDWLYSKRYHTLQDIVSQYEKKESVILWDTPYFCIECTWSQLFDYLRGYNGRIETWFKAAVKYNPTTGKSCVQLQEFKTSKRKIRFLQACPYNDFIPFEEEE